MKRPFRSKIGLVIVLAVIAISAACGGGAPAPQKYQGNWVGSDGTTLYMSADGKAGFRKGGKKVTGGAAVFNEADKTVTISLIGVSETWKIDKEPENGEMTLSGILFKQSKN